MCDRYLSGWCDLIMNLIFVGFMNSRYFLRNLYFFLLNLSHYFNLLFISCFSELNLFYLHFLRFGYPPFIIAVSLLARYLLKIINQYFVISFCFIGLYLCIILRNLRSIRLGLVYPRLIWLYTWYFLPKIKYFDQDTALNSNQSDIF